MCGRFVASRPASDIADLFEVDDVDVPDELLVPRWNVAPQAGVLAVGLRKSAEGAARRLTDFRWGLVPSWAKDVTVGARAFNARAETVMEKPAFRTALAKRRCLVPADAFYEWKRSAAGGVAGAGTGRVGGAGGRPSGREPWCFVSPDGGVLVFAGLYEVWKSPVPDHDSGPGWHDEWLLTCTIITTEANAVVAPVHDRMPVILEPRDWETWLGPSSLEAGGLSALLKPPRNGLLEAYRVSSAVNNSRLEGPELVDPVDQVEQLTRPPEGEQFEQASLFP
jgi:putative SOS response-associated peptidase YedK